MSQLLIEARDALTQIHAVVGDKRFKLDWWVHADYDEAEKAIADDRPLPIEENCGTICCAAGWLAQVPQFRERGIKMMVNTDLTRIGTRSITLEGYQYADVFDRIALALDISRDDAAQLFCERGSSRFDQFCDEDAVDYDDLINEFEVEVIDRWYEEVSDFQVWLIRVQKYLAEVDKGQ